MTSEKIDVYTRVTNQIVAAIEAGAADYRMPWNQSGAVSIPSNVVSKKAYRGINVASLWGAATHYGFETGLWATYRQWAERGCQVRAGERGTCVVFWKRLDQRADDAGEGEGTGESADNGRAWQPMMARGYVVFNADQVDGFELPAVAKVNPPQRDARLEAHFAAIGADVSHGGARAFYRPSTDSIRMPQFESFHEAPGYYSVLAHELTHWTGAPSRLARDLSGRFGNEAYAAEELIAELSAAFQMATLGVSLEPRPDHASYVASWLRALRNDKRAIFTAAAAAQKAADYLDECAGAVVAPEAVAA